MAKEKLAVLLALVILVLGIAVIAEPASAAGQCGEKDCGFWAGGCKPNERCVSGWPNKCVYDASCPVVIATPTIVPTKTPAPDFCLILPDGDPCIGGKCLSGKCVASTPAPTKTPCSKTDVGDATGKIKGTCTPATGKYCIDKTVAGEPCTDYCTSKTSVKEYFCTSGAEAGCASSEFSCSSGYECNDGACRPTTATPTKTATPPVPASGTACTTPTSTNFFLKETCTDATGNHTDECENEQSVNQFYCSSGQCKRITTGCAAGYKCTSGACVAIKYATPTPAPAGACNKEGGNNIFAKGTCKDPKGSYPDKCVGTDGGLTEYYCSGNECKPSNATCSIGYKCVDGQCTAIAKATSSPTPVKIGACTKVGGHNKFAEGTCTDATGGTYPDECIDENNVREFQCSSEGKCTGLAVPCSIGYKCQGNKCISLSSKETPTASPAPKEGTAKTTEVCQTTGTSGTAACSLLEQKCVSSTCAGGCDDANGATKYCLCKAQCAPKADPTPTPQSSVCSADGGTCRYWTGFYCWRGEGNVGKKDCGSFQTCCKVMITATPTTTTSGTPASTSPSTTTGGGSSCVSEGGKCEYVTVYCPGYYNIDIGKKDCGDRQTCCKACPEGRKRSGFGFGTGCEAAAPAKPDKCTDGTPLNGCSETKRGKYCTPVGILKDDPKTCGCPDGYEYSKYSASCRKSATVRPKTSVCPNTICETGIGGETRASCPQDCPDVTSVLTTNACSDGTAVNDCSKTQPGKFCSATKRLITNLQKCPVSA